MEAILTSEGIIALLTLTFLEIVLGIDNIVFISILTNKLPEKQQPKARNIGLLLAMAIRIGLLFTLTSLTQLIEPLFSLGKYPISGKDLVLFLGGLFLIAKAISEIHHKLDHIEKGKEEKSTPIGLSFSKIIFQIVMLDVVFSIDSILTAIGLSDKIELMIIAIVISIIIMMLFAGPISRLIQSLPTLQILALSFLILIGFTLMLEVEALGIHIPKGYIYFAVFFSLAVELINIQIRKRKTNVSKP